MSDNRVHPAFLWAALPVVLTVAAIAVAQGSGSLPLVLVLSALALGAWLGLLAWAIGRAAPSAALQALQAQEQRVALAVRDFVDGEVAETKREIERSRDLVKDAIGKLYTSFQDMEGQTRQQVATITALVEPGTGSTGVRNLAQTAGQLIGDLAKVVEEGGRESVTTVQAMDDTAQALDDVFKRIGGLQSAAPGADELQQLQAKITESRSVVDRVRGMIEESAERQMSAGVDAKIKADALIADVTAVNRSLAEGMDAVAKCSAQIRDAVATAVRSLQFEDITAQSLAAAGTHLERLEAMNQRAARVQEVLTADRASPDVCLPVIEDFGKFLQQLREGLVSPARKSVSQVDMREGAVDLF